MPKPSLRTRSRKRRVLRLPGGRSGTHYEKEKVKPLHCTRCGRILSGVSGLTPSKIRKLSGSQRKVERPYGNLLCPSCLQDLLKQAVRSS